MWFIGTLFPQWSSLQYSFILFPALFSFIGRSSIHIYWSFGGFPGSSVGKEFTCNAGDPGCLWVGKIPWRRKWQPTPVFLSEKSHGQRSLAGYNPWGHKRVRHNLATKGQLSSKLSNQESSSCRPCSSVRGNSILMCSFFCPWAWEDANASGGTLCFIVISSNKGPLLNCLRGCYYYGQWTQYFS